MSDFGDYCIDLMMDIPLVKYGQTAVILIGVLIFLALLIWYRIKTQDRKYKP